MPLAYLLDENLRGPLATGLWHHNLLGVNPVDFICVGDVPVRWECPTPRS